MMHFNSKAPDWVVGTDQKIYTLCRPHGKVVAMLHEVTVQNLTVNNLKLHYSGLLYKSIKCCVFFYSEILRVNETCILHLLKLL